MLRLQDALACDLYSRIYPLSIPWPMSYPPHVLNHPDVEHDRDFWGEITALSNLFAIKTIRSTGMMQKTLIKLPTTTVTRDAQGCCGELTFLESIL